MSQQSSILLVDDDPQALESTRKILELAEFDVTTASDGQAALDLVRKPESRFDLVVTDVRMPRLGGMEFLRALSLCGEKTPVILMTAFGRVEDAVWAMKLGAVDFLTKPFKRQSLLSAVESALKRTRNNGGRVGAQAEDPLIGSAPKMHELRALINQVASSNATVLLNGESGTGKELVAQRVHQLSPRTKGRFIALNCAAIPEQLIESELFGFEKGAFTGASGVKEGLFEAADGGTLLLDEIGDMPVSLQAKLLRTLQEGEVRRLGATSPKKVDVRVIAATHRDLRERVKAGLFREDLLFRLEVINISVPPLRERMDDIAELTLHFLASACRRHKQPPAREVSRISDEALQVLMAHTWPGNVRELSNVIERAVVFATSDEIQVCDLPPHLIDMVIAQGDENGLIDKSRANAQISVPLGTSLREVEDLLIRKTLEATDGDKNMTAKILGINSRTIYRKLEKNT